MRWISAPGQAVSVEHLEGRQLLSMTGLHAVKGAKGTYYLPDTDAHFAARESGKAYTQYTVMPLDTVSSNPPFTPAQIRQAYGANNVLFGALTGDGTGQTVAVIDAYDNPTAIADLQYFSTQWGLPAPSITKVNQTGGTSYPSFDSGWALEIALDVEWVHVMAPNASILLVEASSAFNSDLDAAINYAKTVAGVTAISMSYGGGEYSSEASEDTFFTSPSASHGITYVASTGDSGANASNTNTGYPAMSKNVVAVGGTSLVLSGVTGSYVSETGWSGAGGGISLYISKPAYQNLVTTPSATQRTIPDVAAVADGNTGVYVRYSGNWYQVGGTSLSAPLWAGMIAVVNQGRASIGLTSLDSFSQTLPRLYTLNSADFHDITSGSNGAYSAGVGYDLVTGRGTPIANKLLPNLAGGYGISGSVFIDNSGNNIKDGGESGISGVTVWVDLNNNGTYDSTYEPGATTGASGAYSFTDLVGGRTYVVRSNLSSATYVATGTIPSITSTFNASTTANFGVIPYNYSGSNFTLRMDPTNTQVQVFQSATAVGTPTYAINKALLTTMTFAGTSGADVFNLDLSNGNPLLGSAIPFAAGGNTDTIFITGGTGAETATLAGSSIIVVGTSLTYTGAESLITQTGAGTDTLILNFASGNPGVSSVTSADDVLDIRGATSVDAFTIASSSLITHGAYNVNYTAATSMLLSTGTFTSNTSLSGLSVSAGSQSNVTLAVPASPSSLTLDNGALVKSQSSVTNTIGLTVGALALTAGTLTMVGDGASPGDQSGVLKINNSLTMGASSKIDLKYNAIVLAGTASLNGSAITVASLRGVLITGRGSVGTGGATWSNAGGIGSTSFTIESANSLGYVWNGDPNLLILGGITSVNGAALNNTNYAVKFTKAGDANLDGIVDNIDVGIIGLRYQSTLGNQWYQGDYNYDGVVNNDDVAILGLAYAPSAAPLSPGYTAPLAQSFTAASTDQPSPAEAQPTASAASPTPVVADVDSAGVASISQDVLVGRLDSASLLAGSRFSSAPLSESVFADYL